MRRPVVLLLLLLVIIAVAAGAFLMMDQGGDNTPVATTDPNSDATPEVEETEAGPTATSFPTVDMATVIIAVQDIRRGQEIPAEALAEAPWPREALPFNFIDPAQFDIEEDLAGKIARTDIQVEQPLLLSYIAPSRAELAATGSDVATIIPEGKVAITVPVDRLTSVSYGIQPGDRVDIAVALLFVDIDEEYQSLLPNAVHLISGSVGGVVEGADLEGRVGDRRQVLPFFTIDSESGSIFSTELALPYEESPSEEQRPRLTVQRTVLDAQVLFLDDFPSHGKIFGGEPTPTPVPIDQVETQDQGDGTGTTGDGTGTTGNEPLIKDGPAWPPGTVTVAVTPQEALVLTWLIEARVPLNFFLRSAADNSRVLTDPVTLDYIMETYTIPVPPKRDYTIQPAIRSIRQLLTEDVVPITPEEQSTAGDNTQANNGNTNSGGDTSGSGSGN